MLFVHERIVPRLLSGVRSMGGLGARVGGAAARALPRMGLESMGTMPLTRI